MALYLQLVVRNLPSPCTAFFQALSVNAFRCRIRDERPGDAQTISECLCVSIFAFLKSSHGQLKLSINNFAREYPSLKIGTIDTITKITNLVRVIEEQEYHFESERILLYNVQVISLLVHLQMNH